MASQQSPKLLFSVRVRASLQTLDQLLINSLSLFCYNSSNMQYDLRVGKIVKVQALKDTKYTTHKLIIDFGNEIGKKSSIVSLVRYTTEQLQNKFIVAIVNLPPKQIGTHISEVVALGTPNEKNECVLISPDSNNVIVGEKVY